jgi:hypothetical protein
MSRLRQYVDGRGELQFLMPWHSTVGFRQKAVQEYRDGLFDVIEFLVRLVQESEVDRSMCENCGNKSSKE